MKLKNYFSMTKYLLQISFFFALLITPGIDVQAQDQPGFLNQLSGKFIRYCREYPREEIYLHTDRENYIAGENIWFEAYLIDRQSLKLTNESRIAYIEVLNAENRPVAERRISLENGSGPGQLTLPDTLSQGNYTIRAYTNWMKNFLPSNCFMKEINVYNALNSNNFAKRTFQKPLQDKVTAGLSSDGSNNGFIISIKSLSADTIVLELKSSRDFRAKEGNIFYLFVQTRGNIDATATMNISNDITRIILSKRDLTSGINDIAVFTSAGRLCGERLIFTPVKKAAVLTLNSAAGYGTREKVAFDISLNNTSDTVVSKSNMSISVVPSGSGSFPDIQDYFVFGSEFGMLPFESGMAGQFPGEGKMDSLLASLKSNWIDWNLIQSGTWPELKYEKETNNHFLYGRLINNNTKAPDPERYLFLSIPGKNAVFQYAVTDVNGDFAFTVPLDDYVRDLIIQPEETNRNNVIKQESPYSEKYPDSYLTRDVSLSVQEPVSKMKVNYQIEKIYRSDDTSHEAPLHMFINKARRFYGKPDVELRMDDYIKLPVMQEVFFELMPGVFLKSRKSKYEITVSDPVENTVYEKPPVLFIDGVVINDPAIIANLDPELVERIDAVRAKYFVGDYMFYGLVNVITRAGNFSNIILPDYAVRVPYQVIDPVKTFTSPDYQDDKNKKNHFPDFRNTLYWNPSVKADKSGKIRAEFWSSDFASDYDVVIQGFTSDGKPLSLRKSIKVSRKE